MSDQDIIDTIAAHRGRERGMVCDEGELWCDGCGCIIRDDEWPHHTLAALRERYAVVELPEPDVGAVDNGHVPRHWEWDVTPGSGDFAGTEVHAYSDGVIDVVYESDELTPSQARAVAAALLAAAVEADQ